MRRPRRLRLIRTARRQSWGAGVFEHEGWHQSLEHPDKILSRGYTRIADNLVRIIKRREDAVSRNLLHTPALAVVSSPPAR